MIQIDKGDRGPTILSSPTGRGQKATDAVKALFDAGTREFDFDSDIYAAASVKSKLLSAQCGKCCFCESKITHIDYGDVEHFRPKGGFVQEASHALEKPGYYWLAYDWSNLFLSCTLCNQRFKGNYFPLLETEKRARSHRDNVCDERPVFIHPSHENPEDFIGFHDHEPFGRDSLKRGEMTINALGLRRVELEERRLKQLDEANRTFRTVNLLRILRDRDGQLESEFQELLSDSEAALTSYQGQPTEYLNMLRSAGIAS